MDIITLIFLIEFIVFAIITIILYRYWKKEYSDLISFIVMNVNNSKRSIVSIGKENYYILQMNKTEVKEFGEVIRYTKKIPKDFQSAKKRKSTITAEVSS